jgi:hypothetical protein
LRKSIAIVLLACLTFYITGYHFYFYLRQWQIKTAVKKSLRQGMSRENTEEFVFALNEKNKDTAPEWEGDDEFRLNGEMYDVLEKRVKNGKIFVRCINDEKETSLVKKYEDISRNDFDGTSKTGTILLLKLIHTFYVTGYGSVYENMPDRSGQPFRDNYQHSLSCTIADVLTPPPQFS